MPIFQCEVCGCQENTALSLQGTRPIADSFDWHGIENRKGMLLCSACAPIHFTDGEKTDLGVWHSMFERKYLPKGMFKIGQSGRLVHVETGLGPVGYYLNNESDIL